MMLRLYLWHKYGNGSLGTFTIVPPIPHGVLTSRDMERWDSTLLAPINKVATS